uniref:acylphosphatase n=2 Tax=Aquila chrysaetos chrysaetos TaxID=223781 RepID=A0A663E746_AQUCH
RLYEASASTSRHAAGGSCCRAFVARLRRRRAAPALRGEVLPEWRFLPPQSGGSFGGSCPPARLPLCEAAAYAGSLSLARSRPDAAGRGKAAAPFGRGPESSVLRDSGSSFPDAAAMSALAKASGALKSVDYEVFGRVQGVCFRMYTEEEARKLGVVGWVKNTSKGTVTGQVQGPEDKVNAMKSWLSKVGSPSSRIDRTNFSNEKEISKLDFSGFSTRY